MPYIQTTTRLKYNEGVNALVEALGAHPLAGEINYVVTTLLDKILGPAPRYEDYNRVLGVLEAAKLELYRRRVTPYEDGKCREQGDVYTTAPEKE